MKAVVLASQLDRRRVVEAILGSETFRRADQLKRLLSYLIEQDELGRIHEVTEYELGTRALGRPESFSPETDSSVRTRMHGLRQKLEEFYRDQAEPDELRLEIPKGTYRPQFHSKPAMGLVPMERISRRQLYAGIGLMLLVALSVLWGATRPTPLDRLWMPIVSSTRVPVLVVGQPVHVWVRDVSGQAEPVQYEHFPDPVPNSPMFRQYTEPRLALQPKLALHASPNATLWGDAAGAAAAGRFLAFRKTQSEFVPESTLKSEVTFRGKPILAFGRPEYSPAIQRYLMASAGYTIGMLNEIRQYSIYRTGNRSDRFLNTNPPHEVNHGLITVLNDGGSRVFVFSGITSDGSMAGLDYFTNEEAVAQLWEKLKSEGLSEWPQCFQVVVRVASSSGYAMAAQYEKHLVLRK